MYRMLAVALAAGLAASGTALPAAAQTNCQTVSVTTTRVTNPPTVTPLDAIAFPTILTPQTSSIVRQTIICPPVTTLPPGSLSPPGFATPGIVGAPVYYGYPYGSPYGYPYPAPAPTGVSIGGQGSPTSGAPAYGVSRYPAVSGTVPNDTVRDLATRSAVYDRMLVTVAGSVANVRELTDAGGRPLTTFQLQAQGSTVDVVTWGRLALAPGNAVRVSGPFYLSSPFLGPGGRPWHNVIDAQTIDL
jgi:hypothetical protein